MPEIPPAMLASSPTQTLRIVASFCAIEGLVLGYFPGRPLRDRSFLALDGLSFVRVAPVAEEGVRVPGLEVLPTLAAGLQVWCGLAWSTAARAVRVVRQREEDPGPAPAADLRIRTRGRHRSHVDRAVLRWCAGGRVLIREGASERHDGISVLPPATGRRLLLRALHSTGYRMGGPRARR